MSENIQILDFKSTKKKLVDELRSKAEYAFDLEETNFILCRNCGNPITTFESIIAVKGEHTHTFINPAGIAFVIGCFSRADGCIAYGVPTFEYTWFEGFSWNVAICASCRTHLGWYYQSANETFYGLILDRLLETTKTH